MVSYFVVHDIPLSFISFKLLISAPIRQLFLKLGQTPVERFTVYYFRSFQLPIFRADVNPNSLDCKGYTFESCPHSKLAKANFFALIHARPFSKVESGDFFSQIFSQFAPIKRKTVKFMKLRSFPNRWM